MLGVFVGVLLGLGFDSCFFVCFSGLCLIGLLLIAVSCVTVVILVCVLCGLSRLVTFVLRLLIICVR